MKKIFYILSTALGLAATVNAQSPCRVIDAGPDKTTCYTPFTGFSVYAYPGSGNSISWQTFGSGAFSSPDSNASYYYPTQADFTSGYVSFVATSKGDSNCRSTSDTVKISFNKRPSVKIISETTVCDLDSMVINAQTESGNKVSWYSPSGSIYPFGNNSTTFFVNEYGKISGQAYIRADVTDELGCSNSDSIVIFAKNSVFAGYDINAGATNSINLNGISYASSPVSWSTNGSGKFADLSSLNSQYFPSSSDLTTGYVDLVLTSAKTNTCVSHSDVVRINLKNCPPVSAGLDKNVCYYSSTGIELNSNGMAGSNVRWTSNESGYFLPSDTNATSFIPYNNGYENSKGVMLTVSNTGKYDCAPSVDTVYYSYLPTPTLNIISENSICDFDSLYISSKTETGNKVSWTGGNGTITPLDFTSIIYFANGADKQVGRIQLNAKVINEKGCLNYDTLVIFTKSANMVNAGPDISAGADAKNVALSGAINGTSPIMWTSNGSGAFSDPRTLKSTYIPSAQDLERGYVDLSLTSPPVNNCPVSTDVVRLNLINYAMLSGHFYAGKDTSHTSLVHLFKLIGGTYVESSSLKTNSFYYFNNLTNGSYLVLCQPLYDTSSYLPTYYNSTTDWHMATPIIIQGHDTTNVDFNLKQFTTSDLSWHGTDFITGTISLGNTKNQRISAVGVENANVYLLNLKGEILKGTRTDEFGIYKFNNVAAGTYSVVIDYPSATRNKIPVTIDGNAATNTPFNASLQPEFAISAVSDASDYSLNLAFFPNPVKDVVTLNLPSTINKNAKINIIENTGKVVFSSAIIDNIGSAELDLQALPQGFYIIQLTDGNNVVRNKFYKTN